MRVLAEELMETESAEHVGAERHERTQIGPATPMAIASDRGIRVGTIELKVPRVRYGSTSKS